MAASTFPFLDLSLDIRLMVYEYFLVPSYRPVLGPLARPTPVWYLSTNPPISLLLACRQIAFELGDLQRKRFGPPTLLLRSTVEGPEHIIFRLIGLGDVYDRKWLAQHGQPTGNELGIFTRKMPFQAFMTSMKALVDNGVKQWHYAAQSNLPRLEIHARTFYYSSILQLRRVREVHVRVLLTSERDDPQGTHGTSVLYYIIKLQLTAEEYNAAITFRFAMISVDQKVQDTVQKRFYADVDQYRERFKQLSEADQERCVEKMRAHVANTTWEVATQVEKELKEE